VSPKKRRSDPGRLITKNISICKVVKLFMGLTLAWNRKINEVGDLMIGELMTEISMNDGRNYNGPKIVKFLVG